MCGIAGIVQWQGAIDPGVVRRMIDAQSHRGPDDSGVEALDNGSVVLGHRRLSIMDLSPLGHQPMQSASGRCWIVYNGEIYNFREIKRELEAGGDVFKSESDTEVILAAYEKWGLKCVARFRGMFAFALWDSRDRRLHLCRDRFGVKPLLYSHSAGRIAFSSELRAFAQPGLSSRQVDVTAAAHFLQFGYVPDTTTIYSDVRAVPPGTIMTFAANAAPTSEQFWSNQELFQSPRRDALAAELAKLGEEELLGRLEDVLTEAFQYRMVADVPVGLFLSGGIDSSTVATVLARRSGVRLRTFTIGYGDSEFDETPYAREVASRLGADHTEVILSEQTALDLVQRLPQIADEPIGDSSLIPTFLVSQVARQHVTVALSADGADELFGGYARYPICANFVRRQSTLRGTAYTLAAGVLDRLPASLISSLYAATRSRDARYAGINDKVRKFVRMARAKDRESAYEAAVSEMSRADARRMLANAAQVRDAQSSALDAMASLPAEEQFMYFDTTRYLPGDLLTKVDRASMAVSLEAREPFLDPELAKFATALPLNWKIRGGQNKYALRRILARHLPAELFDRPKKGFSVPIGAWLRGPLRDMVRDELTPARVREFGLLDPQATAAVLQDFYGSAPRTSPAAMWFLFQFHQWAGRWLKA